MLQHDGGDCVCWLCEIVVVVVVVVCWCVLWCGVLWHVMCGVCVRVGGVGVHGIVCVCVCLYICGSMNIGIYMCGVSVCIGVYERPCRCLSVCLSFCLSVCLSVCLSLVDVVVSLLMSMSMFLQC